MNNAVAFTTAFTPPAACLNNLYITGNYSAHSYLLTLGPPLTDQSTSCFPSGWEASTGFSFSPAFSCPSGFMTVSSGVVSIPGASPQTQAICCPSGYNYVSASEDVKVVGELCSRHVSVVGQVIVTSVNEVALTTGTETIGVSTFDGINAYGVRIAYAATDLSSTSTSASTGAAPTTTAAAVTSTASVTADASSGLSTGAKAGIGVGVAIGGLLIIALVAFLFWRRRRHHAADAAAMNGEHPDSGTTQYASPAQYHQPGMVQQQQMYGANGTPVHEGQGYAWNNGKGIDPNQHYSPQSQHAAPAELPNSATMAPVEMEGSQGVHR